MYSNFVINKAAYYFVFHYNLSTALTIEILPTKNNALYLLVVKIIYYNTPVLYILYRSYFREFSEFEMNAKKKKSSENERKLNRDNNLIPTIIIIIIY